MNAAYYSQVNQVRRCYKNVVINLDWAVRSVKAKRMFIIYVACNTIFAILRTMESAVHPSLLSERQDCQGTPSLLPLLDAVLRQELLNSPLLSPGCSPEFSASFCETVPRLWGTESSTKSTMALGHLDSVGVSIGAMHLLPQIPACRGDFTIS